MGNTNSIRFSAYKVNQADNPKKLYKNFRPMEVSTLAEVAEIAQNHAICVQQFQADLSPTAGGYEVPYRRAVENIDAYGNIILVDVDEGDISPFSMIVTLDNSGYAYVLFESMSSTPANPKYHIIFLSDCHSSHKEYKDRYVQFIEDLDLPADMAMKNSVALMAPSFKDPLRIKDGEPVPFSKYKTRYNRGDIEDADWDDDTITEADIFKAIPREDIVKALSFFDPDCSYHEWLDIGMMIHTWDQGEEGLDLWDSWSANAENSYDPEVLRSKWKTFSLKPQGEGLTIRSLFSRAREKGYGAYEVDEEYFKMLKLKYEKELYQFKNPLLDLKAILSYIDNTFYMKDRFYWVKADGTVIDFKKEDVGAHFDRIKNQRLSDTKRSQLESNVLDYLGVKEDAPKAKVDKAIRSFYTETLGKMMTVIKNKRTVPTFSFTVDPFEKRSGVRHGEKGLEIFTNKITAYIPNKIIDPDIVKRYIKHFPQIFDVLDMLTAVRFGADRKEAYLWFHAQSNFGKSLLFSGILGSEADGLGLIYQISMPSLKKVARGEPAGDDILALSKAWGVFVDEARTIPDEMLELTHNITVNPKNKGKVTVPLYFKIFASAENINKLQSYMGSEEQKANRFMIVEGRGNIKEVFRGEDMNHVLKVLQYFVYSEIKRRVDMYLSLGRTEASKHATKVFDELRSRYAIAKSSRPNAKTLTENLSIDVALFLRKLTDVTEQDDMGDLLTSNRFVAIDSKDPKKIILKKPPKLTKLFLEEEYDPETIRSFGKVGFKEIFGRFIEGDYATHKLYKKDDARVSVRGYRLNVDVLNAFLAEVDKEADEQAEEAVRNTYKGEED